MTQLIDFNQDELKKAEEEYKRVKLGQDQKAIFEGMAKLLASVLPINENTIKGFITLVFKDWQIKEKRSISDVATATSEERLKHVKNLLEMFGTKMKKVLRNSDNENEIDIALEKAFSVYTKNFSKR